MLRKYESVQEESLTKFRTKGHKNRHNPDKDLKGATEVLIVKKANYEQCLTCQLCVSDNAYKVYQTDDQFLPEQMQQSN